MGKRNKEERWVWLQRIVRLISSEPGMHWVWQDMEGFLRELRKRIASCRYFSTSAKVYAFLEIDDVDAFIARIGNMVAINARDISPRSKPETLYRWIKNNCTPLPGWFREYKEFDNVTPLIMNSKRFDAYTAGPGSYWIG